jgi:predicted outer membrane repeat protein
MTNTIVVTTAADSGDGSLRAAIAAANTGTTIQFAANLANQTIQLTSGPLQIAPGQQIAIDGQGAAGLTISGNQASRIFWVNSNQDFPASLTLRNLILADGYTPEGGGAIYSSHKGNVTVEQVIFRNNVAHQGGGAIYSDWENNLTVISSQFEGNQAIAANSERGGGAITFASPGNFTVRNSQFLNNRGINGGAINSLNGKLLIEDSRFIENDTVAATFANGNPNDYLRGFGGALFVDRASSLAEAAGSINISNTVFERNRGRSQGGAAYIYTGTQDQVTVSRSLFKDNQVLGLPTPSSTSNESLGGGLVVLSNGLNRGLSIDDTSFINNEAGGQGGGLWTSDTPTTIRNSTFSGNRVTGTSTAVVGGGLTVYSPTTLINTTIANNSAGWSGGGLAASDAGVNLQNTIFANNTAANPWRIQQHTSRELTDWGGNIQFPPKQTTFWNDVNATANIRLVNPNLAPLEYLNGTWVHPLLADSPAINQGVGNGLSTDQATRLRSDGSIDSGAFEFGATGSSRAALAGNATNAMVVNTPNSPAVDNPLPVTTRDPLLPGLTDAGMLTGESTDPIVFSTTPVDNTATANIVPQTNFNPILPEVDPINASPTLLSRLNIQSDRSFANRSNCPMANIGTEPVVCPVLISCKPATGTLFSNPIGIPTGQRSGWGDDGNIACLKDWGALQASNVF